MVSEKERALATGIFNSGTNVGAVIAPIGVPWLYLMYGWQWAFIVTGGLGLLWLVFWFLIYREPEDHPKVSKSELAYILSDPGEATTKIPWLALIPHRQTWAYIIAKFLTDSIWRWYLYLLPLFFSRNFKLDIKSFGPPLIVIYLLADVGSVAGGWLSSSIIKRGHTVNFGRKVALLVTALCVIPVAFVTQVSSMWVAVLLVGMATAAHQGWSANLFTTASDMFPKRAVGSIVGMGGMAGALGAMLILKITGYVLSQTGSFTLLFVIASSAYVTSLLIIHLLVPKLEMATIKS